MMQIITPVDVKEIEKLQVRDHLLISGEIFTGRDAALPRLVSSLKNGEKFLNLQGSVMMHTAVSDAGIAPTSSNKVAIEKSIQQLAAQGVLIHLGKGALSRETIQALGKSKAIYAVTPPAAALLNSKVKSKKIVAFPEEGMEAIHQLEVVRIPAIVAIAQGKSIY